MRVYQKAMNFAALIRSVSVGRLFKLEGHKPQHLGHHLVAKPDFSFLLAFPCFQYR